MEDFPEQTSEYKISCGRVWLPFEMQSFLEAAGPRYGFPFDYTELDGMLVCARLPTMPREGATLPRTVELVKKRLAQCKEAVDDVVQGSNVFDPFVNPKLVPSGLVEVASYVCQGNALKALVFMILCDPGDIRVIVDHCLDEEKGMCKFLEEKYPDLHGSFLKLRACIDLDMDHAYWHGKGVGLGAGIEEETGDVIYYGEKNVNSMVYYEMVSIERTGVAVVSLDIPVEVMTSVRDVLSEYGPESQIARFYCDGVPPTPVELNNDLVVPAMVVHTTDKNLQHIRPFIPKSFFGDVDLLDRELDDIDRFVQVRERVRSRCLDEGGTDRDVWTVVAESWTIEQPDVSIYGSVLRTYGWSQKDLYSELHSRGFGREWSAMEYPERIKLVVSVGLEGPEALFAALRWIDPTNFGPNSDSGIAAVGDFRYFGYPNLMERCALRDFLSRTKLARLKGNRLKSLMKALRGLYGRIAARLESLYMFREAPGEFILIMSRNTSFRKGVRQAAQFPPDVYPIFRIGAPPVVPCREIWKEVTGWIPMNKIEQIVTADIAMSWNFGTSSKIRERALSHYCEWSAGSDNYRAVAAAALYICEGYQYHPYNNRYGIVRPRDEPVSRAARLEYAHVFMKHGVDLDLVF